MKAKFGAIVVDGRGKLGGHVFAKNRSGNYMRTKVTPVNPQTSYQQNQRAALGTLSSGWSGLTDTQRAAWNGAVSGFQKTDIFGDLKTPTGKNLHTGLNRNLLNSGAAIINVPPTPAAIPDLGLESAEFGIGAGTFEVTLSGTTTGSFVHVWATPALSPGTSFIKNRKRFLGSFAGQAAGTIDIAAEYIARFGTPATGQNIHVSANVVNAGGEAGVQETVKATIVA